MCGISAIFSFRRKARAASDVSKQLEASLERIAHRGPDARGSWISPDRRVALAQCRLAINDLRPEGDQPLHSDDGSLHAVVNGEIYDGDRLRQQIDREGGYRFQGRSDSELVLALYKYWGLGFLEDLRGEFSLVLYDERAELLVAARDRFGVKPLYWTVVDDRLLISAEMKALVPLGWSPEWDVRNLADGSWANGDCTPFKGARKIRPGHYMTCLLSGTIESRPYWDAQYPPKDWLDVRTEDEMIHGVRERLLEALRLRFQADVPVGIYLSGGLDSSIIAGMAKYLVQERGETMGNAIAEDKICCFSVEFEENSGVNESDIAARTAEWLGVRLVKCHIGEKELAAHFEAAIYHCENPSVDLGYVGKYCLSKTTQQAGYKVILTGEGADEHFAGYSFFLADYLREPDMSLPSSALASDDNLRRKLFDEAAGQSGTVPELKGLKAQSRNTCAAARQLNNISTLSTVTFLQQPRSLYAPWVRRRYEHVDDRDTVARNLAGAARRKIQREWHPLHAALYTWNQGVLPNLILCNLGDRTEMAHSVEARPPFLDHVLANYVNGLPPSCKIRYTPAPTHIANGANGVHPQREQQQQQPPPRPDPPAADRFIEKWILREVARPFVTDEIYVRRKHPYVGPRQFSRDGPMAQLFRRLVNQHSVEALGFLDWNAVEKILEQALAEQPDAGALRSLFVMAGWVTLGQMFEVPKADVGT